VHLVGFITKKFVTMHGNVNVKKINITLFFFKTAYLSDFCNYTRECQHGDKRRYSATLRMQ